jgi:2-polyprenyl-6-methoxyphenol hydroxylase-like FAD-dependent oxidoreductase
VAIVGAGVGGLALAILLSRNGHTVTVLERFTEPRPIGSGLMLQPAGLAALDRLGLRGAIEELGHRVGRLHGVTGAGRIIFDLAYGDLAPELYAVGVHRAALHGVLWGAFQNSGAALCLGHEVSSPQDPLLAAADFVVDASGSRSVLRGLVSNQTVRAYPYGAVWASVPDIGISAGALSQRYVGARVMLGYLPVGAKTAGQPASAALFWSLRSDQYQHWRDRFEQWRDDACALWPALSPVLTGLSGAEEFTHATYHHFSSSQPWRGNLVLIGDAAHATSPQLGQGANHALIDAVVLTDALATASNLADAFALYARTRRRHVRFYQHASRLMTPFFQSDSQGLALLRDRLFHPMRHVPWLHGEMLRTLAGLKTGLFTAAKVTEIVNRPGRL